MTDCFAVSSVAVETAELASVETVVGGLGMSIVGDHAVVTRLSWDMSCDDWALICATSALWHAIRLLYLHLVQALLR